MNRKSAFDKVAVVYDEVRPSYPEKLIKEIIDRSGLIDTSRILEIGAGTGKATEQFAERGFGIHCIEPGENMAEILKHKCSGYPKVTVDVSSFEDWMNPYDEPFNLVFAAQSFHWIPEKIRYKKSYELLREDGVLALFWYEPYNIRTIIEEEIETLFREKAPTLLSDEVKDGGFQETKSRRALEIEDSGLFQDVQIHEFLQENKMDGEEYMKTLNSYSKFVCLEEEIKEEISRAVIEIIEKHGGYKKSGLMFSLFTAKRK